MRYALALLLAACSTTDDGPCIEGETRACTCASGARGAQACLESGGLSPCVCVADAGADIAGDTLELDTAAETIACVCERPSQDVVEGVLQLALTLGPDKPISFAATFTLGAETVVASIQARDAEDGSLVGTRYEAAGRLDRGVIDVGFGDIEIPAAANAIVEDLAIALDLRLRGCLAAALISACGQVEGAVTEPVQQSIDGSVWTLAPALTPCACP